MRLESIARTIAFFVLTGALFFIADVTRADVIHDGGTIYGHAVWYASDNDHIVTGVYSIASGGSLTIQAGCTVKFDHGIYFNIGGTLNILGTAGNEVLLTRRDAEDEWAGLQFNSGSSGSLEYCTIEHATRYSGAAIYANGAMPNVAHCTIRDNDYGIYISGCTSPTLSVNNVIQDNTIAGIYATGCTGLSIANQTITGHGSSVGALHMDGTGSFHLGTGNSITGNSWGLTMNVGSYPDAASDGNIPMAGNTNSDGIQVYGGTLYGSATWYDVAADFIMTSVGSINGAGSLEIRPDVTVKLDHGIYFNIGGTLDILGAAGNEVLLTRRDADDEWAGLQFNSSSSGSLEYCTIEHATRYSSAAINANGAMPDVEHCTIRDNDYGIYISGCTSPTLSVNNVIQDNTIAGIYASGCTGLSIANQTITGHGSNVGALHMDGTGSFHLGTGNSITGNSWGLTMNVGSYPDAASDGNIPVAGNTNSDGIQVFGGTLYSSATWYDVAADFIVTSVGSINGAGSLEIRPDVTVKLDHGIYFNIGGTLNIAGTAGNEVLLTRRDVDDEWAGLQFNSGSGGSLEYCTIEHATRYTGSGLYCNAAAPSLAHCTIRYNDYGIYLSAAHLSMTNCVVTENMEYGLYLNGAATLNLGGSLAEWNDIYNNGDGEPDRDLRNGTETVHATYVYWGTVSSTGIENRVHHEPDDPALGRVYFSPWTNAAHDTEYTGGPSAVPDDSGPELPTAFRLAQNHPNPFNPATIIAYDLPRDSHVELSVMDLSGRRVATLVSGHQSAGAKSVRWDPRHLSSGTYIYHIKADDFEQTRKMVLLR